jgi:septal ring factor EnvC (AmiA/AmiB activator)
MKKFENLEEAQSAFDSQSEELEATKKDNESLKKNVEQLEADATELKQQVASLSKKLTEKEQSISSGNGNFGFTRKKDKYRITAAQCVYNKVTITAEEIMKNPTLQDELIDKKVGFIEKIEA